MVQQMPSPYPNMPNMMKYIPSNQKMIIPTQPIMMVPGYMGYPTQNTMMQQGMDKAMQMTPNFSTMSQINIQPHQIDKAYVQMNMSQIQTPINQINNQAPNTIDDIKIEKA